MNRIPLIEHDPESRDKLTSLLQHEGFQVLAFGDTDQALSDISTRETAVIVMTEALAKPSGDSPCMRIRAISRAPLIILGQQGGRRGRDSLPTSRSKCLSSPSFGPRFTFRLDSFPASLLQRKLQGI